MCWTKIHGISFGIHANICNFKYIKSLFILFKISLQVLDGITIRNLDILTGPLSLFSTVDKCGTNFGRRLLRQWICLPLAIPDDIMERQNAVEELMGQRECREKVSSLLKGLPDLERLLSK